MQLLDAPTAIADKVIAQLQMPQPAPDHAQSRQILEEALPRKSGP